MQQKTKDVYLLMMEAKITDAAWDNGMLLAVAISIVVSSVHVGVCNC
jgi:hypothetical protein